MQTTHCNIVLVLSVTRYEPIIEQLVEGNYLHVVLVDCGSTVEDYCSLLSVMRKNPSAISVIREDNALNESFGSLQSVQGLKFAVQAFPRADMFVQIEPNFENLEELLGRAQDADIVVVSSARIGRRPSEFVLECITGVSPHFLFSQVCCYTSASLRSLALDDMKCTGIAFQAEIRLRLWRKGYTFGDVVDDSTNLSRARISFRNLSKLILVAMTCPSRSASK